MTIQAVPLSIETLKKALERFDWGKVKTILDASGQTNWVPEDVAEALRRAGRLVLTHPSKAELKRDELFEGLKGYLAQSAIDGTVPAAYSGDREH